MALSGAIRVQVPSELVFPFGALVQGVEPELDFDLRAAGVEDAQKRDKESGVRVWVVRVVDLDRAALRFGGSAEAKVKITAEHRPVPPSSEVPGYPPRVDFEGIMLTPYVDGQRCSKRGHDGRCKARQAFSIRAASMVPSVAPAPPPVELDPETGEVIEITEPAKKTAGSKQQAA